MANHEQKCPNCGVNLNIYVAAMVGGSVEENVSLSIAPTDASRAAIEVARQQRAVAQAQAALDAAKVAAAAVAPVVTPTPPAGPPSA